MTRKKQIEDQDVGDALNRWEVDNVIELDKFVIKIKDNKVVEKREVDEYLDGAKTGNKITIYLFQLENDNSVKEAKFGKQSMQACIKKWGKNAANWAGKKVSPIFAKVGNNSYIIWKPMADLDK